MNVWDILGVEETKDKEQLKAAYRRKLRNVNPEDDPEGFMRLRGAYEEAVRLAEAMEDSEEASEDSDLLKKIKSLYNNYSRRIDVNEWEELLDQDEFVALDSSQDALDTLIRFLMEKYFVPKDVWKLIVDKFDIKNRAKELAEVYPENFIDYMINNSLYDDILDYSLLESKDEIADKFLDRYFSLDVHVRKHNHKEQKELIQLIEEMDAYHPYFELLKIRSRIQEYDDLDFDSETESQRADRMQMYQDMFQNAILLHEDFPEDVTIMGICGDLKTLLGDYQESGEFYDKALALKPDNYILKGKQAELKFMTGDYAKSRDLFMELIRINHYDNSARNGMIRANTELIKELKAKRQEDPDDKKLPMEIGWSLYQIYKFKDAIEVLDSFKPDDSQTCEYNNLKGRVYLCLSEYEDALKCFFTWRDAIESIPKGDDSKDARDKRKRINYVQFLIGDCYLRLRDYDTAREYFKLALEKEHEEMALSYEAMCELEYNAGNYEACVEACDRLLAIEKRSLVAYNNKAKACFELDYIKEAMDASFKAIEIYPYIAEPYEIQIKIHMKYKNIEMAKNVIQSYNETGIISQRMLLCSARIALEEGKLEEALGYVEKVLGDNEDISDLIEEEQPYIIRAYIYEEMNKPEEAISAYEKAVEINPEHSSAYGHMGLIYKNTGKLTKALEMFDKQIEVAPSALAYINRGTLNRFFQKYKSALEDFKNALEYEPDNAFCHSRIGLIYEYHREFKEALASYDNALRYVRDDNGRSQIYTYKARTLQCMNLFNDAMELYDKYIDEFGMNPDIAYDISELALRMGRIDYATGLLEECINRFEYDENVKQCVVQLIAIFGLEGYVNRANETLQLAVNRFGAKPEFFATMGEVLRDKGLYDAAVRHYETAVKLDTEGKQNYYSELVEVLKKKNPLRQDLKKYVQKALINPAEMTNPMAYIKMARLNRVLKKNKEALSIIDKSLEIKRCAGCFYGRCHEAFYQKGLIYEAMKDYGNAKLCYRQALEICGHNALYEESIKRLEKKGL